MTAISSLRALTALGVCLSMAAPAGAQIGPLPKGKSLPVGNNNASAHVNQAPVCNAGATQFLECQGTLNVVQLDGSLSYDPDGDPITFEWSITGTCNNPGVISDPSSPTPTLTFDPLDNCLDECGAIQLRVRDGQTSSFCKMAVVIHDLMPPTVNAPLDKVEPRTSGWPMQASTAVHGVAGPVDVCDSNPIAATYTDVYTSGPIPSGVEDIIHRTWTAVDACGNQAQQTQVLVFLAPSFFAGVPLDVIPGSCTNLFQVGPGLTTFDAALLAETGFLAGQVQLGTIQISRADGQGQPVYPMSSQVLEMGTPSVQNSCANAAPDAQLDVLMTFDQNEVINKLMLDTEPDDAIVVIKILGKDQNGNLFKGWDLVRVQSNMNIGGGTGGGSNPTETQHP